MQRHHRDRDILWLTSGLPFLTWASASPSEEAWRRSAAVHDETRTAKPTTPAKGAPDNSGPAIRSGQSPPPPRGKR